MHHPSVSHRFLSSAARARADTSGTIAVGGRRDERFLRLGMTT
jgi:hypothetical protein